ncbi:olfactory receptor 11H2-like [Xenentodon cancila]
MDSRSPTVPTSRDDLKAWVLQQLVIFGTVYILIICCNCTIVYLIWIHKNLHEPMYIFIAALLINCALYSTSIYPKLLIDFLSEKQVISYSACLFQFFTFYSLGGSEFLLLAAMAYDRYVSICKPLLYSTVMSRNRVSIFLGLSWFVPACQNAVPVALTTQRKLCTYTLNGIFCNNLIYNLHCVTSTTQSIFGIAALIMAALFPLLFIIFTYTRILIVTYRSCKEMRKKAAQTCLPHLVVLISFSCLCAYDIIIVRLGPKLTKTWRLVMYLQEILYHPLLNPIIYGLKMTEITKHLRNLLCQAKVF